MNKKLVLLLTFLLLLLFAYLNKARLLKLFLSPNDTTTERGITTEQLLDNSEGTKVDIEVIAENLEVPWDIEFIPGGDMLVTERVGKLIKIGKEEKTIKEISGLFLKGEAGLLGMALHPKFEENNYIYLYETIIEDGNIENRVERYKLINDELTDKKIIFDGIKGSVNHDGGRMKFGPDGYLYITTGDAENKSLAQDTSSLNGKILRVDEEGKAAGGNPFGNEVYSFGHRNPQGLAWDDKGQLWETEHGPSGTNTGYDEINNIFKGFNYGWPDVYGDQKKDGVVLPILQSGKQDTWAPASLVYLRESLFFGGLRGEALYQAEIISDNKLKLTAHFKSEYGRIREVEFGPDGFLYISTSNRDGRGTPKEGDDKIIRINPQIFYQ